MTLSYSISDIIIGIYFSFKRFAFFFVLDLVNFIKDLRFIFYMTEAKYDDYGTKLVNEPANITFKCPSCLEVEISRSRKARELSKEYKCPKCGFVGP